MISIIIPSYNRADIIAETLDSIISQTYVNWECIIVDDGSTDDTETVIKKYTELDCRFFLYKRPSTMLKGANSCRNFGFLKAKGKYVKFLDSDDVLTSDSLAKQVAVLEGNAVLNVCLSYGRYFNNETKELEEFWSRNKEYGDYLYGHITNQIMWAVSDPLWRKSFFDDPPFREGLMNSQEWLMHGEALLKLKREEIYNLQETFTLIRRGNERMSSNTSSSYYKNQKLARIYLLKSILGAGIFNLSYFYELAKQILVYKYWQLKQN
ncbi:glycosyltransferase family 2 protein [Kaistella faecalis]|uniref:glycosyltransferase family 2 protein n=1 Tax=Kaistella faecalis TaxID=2852098 RepID=UPI001C457D37|nr:glycosyltransferase family 2 protein [Chryseobacterium faecale]UFK97094.1 glycosyltransferase [Chryseobacterium faecale]